MVALAILAPVGTAPAQQAPPTDLSKASLEELMNVQVTSASRREQPETKVASAIYVITQEDIRRSGATNLPDLLRMVPGLDVAQINANAWAISARGFNGQFANKMLVMIDGRTVYDPSFSGVYWDAQDVVLEDIERIEVIRGPGATVWGANAVNGVINILTKSAKDTQGVLVVGGGGSAEQGFGTLQYGGKLGRHAVYRVFAKYFNQAGFLNLAGVAADDNWRMRHAGFRTDWDLNDRDSLTFQGDLYGAERGQPLPQTAILSPPYFSPSFTSIDTSSGGNILARWTHSFHSGSQMSLQFYFSRISREDEIYPESRNTFDVDFQHQFHLGSRNAIVWGFGFRNNSDHLGNNFTLAFQPHEFSSWLENAFVQDEFALVADKLWLTAGVKLEHHVYFGYESEPSVRLLWAPAKHHIFWTAVSNANRIPARVDESLRATESLTLLPSGLLSLVTIFGRPGLPSEGLDAFEFGYRFEASRNLSFDLASYFNRYFHLRTYEPAVPFLEASPLPPHLVVPLFLGDKAKSVTYGAEASLAWKATSFWKLFAGYAWIVPSMQLDPSSGDTTTALEFLGDAPRNQFQIRSRLDLPRHWEFDNSAYWVGRLATGPIPAYLRFDTRLGWRLAERAELSVVGQNLFLPRHPEFNSFTQSVLTTQPRRSVFAELTWRY